MTCTYGIAFSGYNHNMSDYVKYLLFSNTGYMRSILNKALAKFQYQLYI